MVDPKSEIEPDDQASDDEPDDGAPGDDAADDEISLDGLAAAYAGLVGGSEGAAAQAAGPPTEKESSPSPAGGLAPAAGLAPAGEPAAAHEPVAAEGLDKADADEQVSPLGILEAVLFVGNAENTPLTAKRIAALMRGVSPREIDELVVELNGRYREFDCPYEIVSHGAGYLLGIRDEYAGLRDRFYGSVREARLSQAAIDILAVIAYGQPLTREEIDETRGKPSGGILSQLVRRQLLRIERPSVKPRRPKYYTTDRFLKIMGLEDISELPESQEFDKTF